MKFRLAAAAVAVAATTLGLAAPSALANGPCGVNYNGSTACGVTAPATISGAMVQGDSETDYYVFCPRARWCGLSPGGKTNFVIRLGNASRFR
jgi:hypothetical protein